MSSNNGIKAGASYNQGNKQKNRHNKKSAHFNTEFSSEIAMEENLAEQQQPGKVTRNYTEKPVSERSAWN